MIFLNYNHLYYFWVVAKEGGITKACKKLFLAQPTVSQQLKKLEKALGRKLFIREKRRLILTDDGRWALNYADAIFSLGERMINALENQTLEPGVELRLGVVNLVAKPVIEALVKDLKRTHPDLRLSIQEGAAARLLENLISYDLDIVISDVNYPIKLSAQLFHKKIGESPVIFAASPELAKKFRRFPKDLPGIPLLVPAEPSATRRDIDDYLHRLKVPSINITGEAQDAALLRLLALGGVGVVPLSLLAIKNDLKSGRLKALNHQPTGITESYWLITRKKAEAHPVVDALMENYECR